MNKKRILSLAAVLGMTFLIAGCNSNGDKNETVNKTENDNAEKYEEVFKETDEIAHDFLKLKIEQNYPEILKYMSTKGIEELEEKSGYLLDAHRLPNEYEELDGMYELRRYDNFYNVDDEAVIYRYSRHNDRDVLVNDWIILKQNDEGNWKVRSFYDVRPDMINDSNSESGTVLHELPEEDKGN